MTTTVSNDPSSAGSRSARPSTISIGTAALLGGGFPRRGIGLDREQRRDLRRIVLEGSAVTRADLEHAPLEAGKEPAAQLARAGIGPPLLAPLEEARETALLRPVERRTGWLRRRHGRIDGSSTP